MKLNLINTEIGTISTMADGGNKIVLYTPELSTEEMTALFMAKKQGIADEIEFDAELKGKTPGSRLRNVLYLLWGQDYKNKFESFDEFYPYQMNMIIDYYKEKLEPKKKTY